MFGKDYKNNFYEGSLLASSSFASMFAEIRGEHGRFSLT